MTRFRTLTLLAALAGTLAIAAPSGAAVQKLTGTVGPGFTISLKKAGRTFKTLRTGTYSITVADKSNIHNFRLKGPGVNKEITSISFVGTKTVVLKLTRKGKYTFICDPHASIMKGSFTVT